METFDISDDEQQQAQALSREIVEILDKAGLDRRVIIAALAEAGSHAVDRPSVARAIRTVAS